MTPEEWARLRAFYHAALNMSGEERARLLDQVRQESQERADKLEELLADQGKSTIEINDRTFIIDHLANEAPPLTPGDVLQKRFKIVRLVGTGGMGDVYEAIDLVDERTVALKTITGDFASDPRSVKLLQSEVNVALQVSGPDVCRIHAFYPADGSEPSIPFFTMEYLNGITLSDKLRKSGRFPWTDVKRIAKDVCAGLTVIHQENIIHRDLKPRNVMLAQRSDREHAVVMDFGIAQTADPPQHAGAMAGTVEYMAPEQFEGQAISPATDIFGLGVLLYELLTGVLPFPSTKPLKALMERADRVKPVSVLVKGLPRHWDRVIDRCLAFKVEQRYQTAAEVFRALSTGSLHLENFRRDRPRLFAAACMIPAALLLWGGIRLRQYSIEPKLKPEAQRWYDAGLVAIHEGTYVTAIGRLKQANDIDPGFPMTHAWLAEAWESLDFRADAQRELLLVDQDESRLPALDQLHYRAIRDTISENYEEGIAIYARLLRQVPPREQSAADVDLGMAYERSGEIEKAMALYRRAAVDDRSSPAPYVHIAVLENRSMHFKEADQAFETAEKLFGAEVSQEGLAELHYERGHALNERYDGRNAKPFLVEALTEARALTKTGKDTIPLQVQCMIQIVNADYLVAAGPQSAEYVEAKEMADQAASMARDHGLDEWLTDSLIVQANMLLKRRNYQEAEDTLNKAIERANQAGQPRVKARANLTLASLKNMEDRPDEIIQPAQAARDFFKRHGYRVLAEYSSMLITRAYRDQLQYSQAEASARETLEFAKLAGVRRLIMQSEQNIGSVYTAAEFYPAGIQHCERAISFADSQDDKDRVTLSYAHARWLAGQYHDSDVALASLPATSNVRINLVIERTASLLSRLEYAQAKSLAESELKNDPQADPRYRQELEWTRLVAQAHLQPRVEAISQMRAALGNVAPPETPNAEWAELWDKKMQLAEAELSVGLLREAQNDGIAAANFFSSISREASQLRSIFIAAAASRKLNDEAQFTNLSNKAVDISTRLQHNWGPIDPAALHIYLSRPDIRSTAISFPIGVPGGTT